MDKIETQVPQLPGNPKLPSSAVELKMLSAFRKKDTKYSVEDFFRHPERTRFQLSPAGDYFSFLGPHERRLNLFVQATEGGGEAKRLTSVEDRDIAWYFWKTNETIIYGKDAGGDENFHLYAVNVNSGEQKNLTPFEGVRINLIDDLEDFEDEIIIGMNKNRPEVFEPFRLNVRTGELTLLAKNENPAEPLDSWMTDHEGKLRIASKVIGTNSTLLYRAHEGEDFREVLTTDFREGVTPLFFHFEKTNWAYVSTNIGRDKQVVTIMDMETGGEVGDPIFAHDEVDVSSLSYSRKRKVTTAISYVTDKRHLHFLDKTVEGWYAFLRSELPGYEIILTSWNRAEDKLMVRTYSDRSLGAYYFFDTQKMTLKKIADVSPWLNESDLAEMKPISYQSRDGLTIHGYLTLPKNKEAKNLPIIINPHGGPWVRDNWGYNPEVQLLANQGLGVLQMNYRGSTGYGRKFWECSFKKWGREMQDDITDGVNWLIESGIADPQKVAIYGGSYGGYATLAGVAFTPDLYACAIDYVGVSNLFTFMTTIPPYWKPYLEMMYEMVGNPETDKEQMTAASPVFHIDKIKAPLFVAQGANDPRVNIDESDQIVEALRSRGVEVLYMVKYDEGHGFHNEENRFEFYEAMLGFLGKHLA